MHVLLCQQAISCASEKWIFLRAGGFGSSVSPGLLCSGRMPEQLGHGPAAEVALRAIWYAPHDRAPAVWAEGSCEAAFEFCVELPGHDVSEGSTKWNSAPLGRTRCDLSVPLGSHLI